MERTGGFETIWQVENDDYCTKVLEKHWPKVRRYGDVRRIESIGYADLICGGFPCQPVSHAGKRKGTEDSRWLWPEFIRIVRMVRPRYVLVENVPGLLSANEGLAMSEVLGDLAESGYDCEWNRIGACTVGAPHRRERVFIVAYPAGGRLVKREPEREKADDSGKTGEPEADVAYRNDSGFVHRQAQEQPTEARFDAQREPQPGGPVVADTALRDRDELAVDQRHGKTAPQKIFGDGSGISGRRNRWPAEPGVGRVAHGVPSRVDRLKCLGNAIVPQVAEAVGYMILEFEKRGRK